MSAFFGFGLDTWAEGSLSFKFGLIPMSNGRDILDFADDG